MLEIFKLIYEYSKNGKLVDKEFIERLVQLEIRLKHLDSYIQHTNIHIKTDDPNDIGTQASYIEGTLHVFMEEINKLFESEDKYLCLFPSSEKIFYRNSIVTQIILHEIEHGDQKRIINIGKNIEASLLRLSICNIQDLDIPFEEKLEIYIKRKYAQLYYLANYTFDPSERLAEIKSNREIICIFSPFSEFLPVLLDFFKTKELESTLMGYMSDGILVAPTLEYLSGLGMDKYLTQLNLFNMENSNCLIDDYKKKFDLPERLLYGFPIDNKECDAILNTLKRSRKWNC